MYRGRWRTRPQTKLAKLSWCGVSTHFIGPQDPLFREIQVKFLREQEKELGTDHYYGTDPFNEMTPPSWEPEYLASVSKAIYGAMTEADPDAVWVQMAWTFRGGSWTNPRLEAMIKAVPLGRMVLLDYFCEDSELWRKHKFFGAPFIWNYLGNFGGNTVVRGPVNLVNERITAVMNDASLTNFAGIGSTLEGLNNQSIYEFLFQRAWEGASCDTATWLRAQAQCHAGAPDAAMESAYATFWLKTLGHNGNDSGGDVFMMVPRLAPGSTRGYLGDAMQYRAAPLVAAWKQMLEAAPTAREHDAYRADLVEVTRLALTTVGDGLRRDMFAAYQRKDAAELKKLSDKFIDLGHDLDALLGTRSNLLFGKWVADARAWGKDAAEADYYERNARTIVTTWLHRGHSLNDYAGRDWNGLLSGYYLGRWQMYLDAMGDALSTGKEPAGIDGRVADFEWTWAQSAGGQFKTKPEGDSFEISLAVFKKYGAALPIEIATWSPEITPADFAEMRWPLPAVAQQRKVLRIRLQYEGGGKALEIHSVALKAGDKILAEDRHDGWTGDDNRQNVYALKLPAESTGEKLTLVVTARGAGGTQSSGSILLESEP